jgi:hypothetical protein
MLAQFSADPDIAAPLLCAKLPHSCEEVNLELEYLEGDAERKALLELQAEEYRNVTFRRREGGGSRLGGTLRFDEAGSKEYTWTGMKRDPMLEGTEAWTSATYHVIRLCWRSGVPRREYMHLDRLDCLMSNWVKDV